MSQSVFEKAATGLSILFVMKIFSRIIDFVLNILVLRDVEPSTYGLTIHYMVLTNVSLFYTKMCLKNSYQKRGLRLNGADLFVSARNIMIFGVGSTILTGSACGVLWDYWYSTLHEEFRIGMICFIVAAIVESMCEPLLSKHILSFDYSIGAKSEAVAVFTKTLFLFALTKSACFGTLINFGLAQIFYAAMMLLCCVYFGGKQNLIPSVVEGKDYYVAPEMKDMGKQFTILSFLKLISQELEKLVLINVSGDSIRNQSEYLLVSNIGSMIPRYVYAPIEEVSFNLFAKLSEKKGSPSSNATTTTTTTSKVSSDNNSSSSSTQSFDGNENESDSLISDQKKKRIVNSTAAFSVSQKEKANEDKEDLDQALVILTKVMQFVNIIGCIAICFGIPYASAFLQLLYGDKWNIPSCVLALQTYCVYEWVMGMNGITEAFVQGTIDKEELSRYRFAILGSTLLYVVTCVFLVEYGSAGVITACILSMVSRIWVSLYFIAAKMFGNSLTKLFAFLTTSLPKTIFLFGSVLSLAFGWYISNVVFPASPLKSLFVGAVNAGVLLLLIAKQSVRELTQLLGKKSAPL